MGKDLYEGIKYDEDKNRMELIPPEVIEWMGKVLTYGAKKYDDENWRGLDKERYQGALMRHFNDYRKGEKIDKDSGLPSIAMVVCNAAFLLCKELEEDSEL